MYKSQRVVFVALTRNLSSIKHRGVFGGARGFLRREFRKEANAFASRHRRDSYLVCLAFATDALR